MTGQVRLLIMKYMVGCYNKASLYAFRYIRLACDCFGPHGDEKHGCQELWEAFCAMTEIKSAITLFRNNRFNNYFEAAAALHFHREDISSCLQSLPKINRKLESVQEDNRSDEIDCQLIALGLLFYRVTGPYWELLGRDVHYLDFCHHVVRMHDFLQKWAENAVGAFADEFEPLFGTKFMPNASIFRAMLNSQEEETKEEVKRILKKLCEGCLGTTKRQLADFLPGGRYHGVQDEDTRKRLQHSKLTNLIGEQAFGDLDFSLFKRRNASLHHHSTINMLKRNKSISTFLNLKTPEEQHSLLQLSKQKAAALRKKHRQDEKDAIARRQLILEETHAKKIQAEDSRRKKILDITTKLRPHAGPCAAPVDVDRLNSYTSAKERMLAIRAELLFQKLVLLKSSPYLKVTGTMPQLVQRLKQFLGADEAAANAEIPPLPGRQQQPAAKRQRLQPDTDSDDSEASDPESETDSVQFQFEEFSFQQQGQLVAVYFLEDFFVGEVTAVVSPQEAVITFMEKAAFQIHGQPAFRWPRRKDECAIAAEFVFTKNIILAPSSTSGRAFIVTSPEKLTPKYAAFKAVLAAAV